MNRYEAIYIRKSVRRYSEKAIPADLLHQITNCSEKLPFLQEEGCCRIRIYSAKEAQKKIRGVFRVNAPYYMAVFTKKTEFALVEAGCYAERLVLYMTTKGLGTCYQGGCKLEKSQIPADMQLAIIVAFGYADGELTREAVRAKRQPLSKLCYFRENIGEDIRLMLKAARLAPSAMNHQPWRFLVKNDRLDLYLMEDSLFKNMFASRQLIDIGIALCHMLEAADEQWMSIEVLRDESKLEREAVPSDPKGSRSERKKTSGKGQLTAKILRQLRYIITIQKIRTDPS